MGKFVWYLVLLASLAIGGAWYAMHTSHERSAVETAPTADVVDASWLSDLYSQNPRDTEKGAGKVTALGARAVPTIQATLRDSSSSRDHRRAALRACAILGMAAEPAIPEVAAALPESDLAPEAASALSFMGPKAFPPLAAAVTSEDATVRREALRSIGKLRFRAPVESSEVMPRLLDGMIDPDGTVRTVAATYLGIIHEEPDASIPLLMQGLEDPDPGVRRAAASALGAFGTRAAASLPALRKASVDQDQDLAREAGRAMVAVMGSPK